MAPKTFLHSSPWLLALVLLSGCEALNAATISLTPERIQIAPQHATIFIARRTGPGRGIGQLLALRWSATGGDILGIGPVAIYRAGPEYGLHTVTARVGRGAKGPSGTAQIKVGTIPTAAPVTVTTAQDTAVAIALTGADPDGDVLTSAIVDHPQHGGLSGSDATWTYTPHAGFVGTDSFTYRVSDGWAVSPIATVTVTVTAGDTPPPNQPPVITLINPSAPVMLVQPASILITASATDADGQVNHVMFTATTTESATTLVLGVDSDGSDGWSAAWNAIPVGTWSVTATARDNDGAESVTATVSVEVVAPVTVAWEVAASSVAEASGTASIAARLSAASPLPIDVTYSVLPEGTATPDADHGPVEGVLTFAPGSTIASVTVTIVDDALHEGDETVVVALTNPTTGTLLGTPATHVLTIIDDDLPLPNQPPSITLTNPSAPLTLVQPANVVLSADAADSDGSVTMVTFTANDSSTTTTVGIDVDGSDGWTVPWNAIPVGTWSITATAQDDVGAETISAAVAVTVVAPVSVAFSSATSSVGEADGTATVAVSLATAFPFDVTVGYRLAAGGTATADLDHGPVSGTLTFPAGSAEPQTVTVAIVDDALYEADETVRIDLHDPSAGALVGSPSLHMLTIIDIDPAPIVAFAEATSRVAEDAGTVALTVQLDAISGRATQVPFEVVGGTASPGSDYQVSAGTLTIPAGNLSGAISVSILTDEVIEADETVLIALGVPTHASLGAPSVHTLTILGTNQTPVITAGPTATLDPADPTRLLLSVTTSDDGPVTQLCHAWQVSGPGGVSLFPNGSCVAANAVATVTSVGTYTVQVTVTDALGASVNANTTGVVSGVPTAASVTPMTVDLAPGASQTFTASVTDQFTTAITPTPALTWSANPSSLGTISTAGLLTVSASAIDADSGSVTATVTAAPSVSASATVTVVPPITELPTLAWASADGGLVNEDLAAHGLPVVLSAASAEPITVHYQVSGTATAGVDHALTDGSVTIAAGATTATLSLLVLPDSLLEGDETVIVTLTGVSGATLGSPLTHTVTIQDDDLPIVDWATSAASIVAGDTVGTTLRLRSSAPAPWALHVPYTVGGTALAGSDHTLNAGTLTIPAGSTSASLVVVADAAAIDGRTIELILDAELTIGALVAGSTTATVTIVGADAADATESPTVRLDPSQGSFVDTVSVTLAAEPAHAAIWFTIDGSTPVPGAGTAQRFQDPLELTATTTVRAVAALPDGSGSTTLSDVASGEYVRVSSDGFGPAPHTPPAGARPVSPVCLEWRAPIGGGDFTLRLEVHRDGQVVAQPPVHRLDARHAYADVPLDPDGAVEAVWILRDEVGQETRSEPYALTWAVTDLSEAPVPLALRAGDSLLLTASGSGDALEIDLGQTAGSPAGKLIGTPGQGIPARFDVSGFPQVSAWIDGEPVANRLNLSVLTAAIPSPVPLAGEVDFDRPVQATAGPDAGQVHFSSSDAAILTVAGTGTSGSGELMLSATALVPEQASIVARVGGVTGAIVVAAPYHGFCIEADPIIQAFGATQSTITAVIHPTLPRDWFITTTTWMPAVRVTDGVTVLRTDFLSPVYGADATVVTAPRPVIRQQGHRGEPLQVSCPEALAVARYQLQMTAAIPSHGTFLTIGPDSDGDGIKDYGPLSWTVSIQMTPAPTDPQIVNRVRFRLPSSDTWAQSLSASGSVDFALTATVPWTAGHIFGTYYDMWGQYGDMAYHRGYDSSKFYYYNFGPSPYRIIFGDQSSQHQTGRDRKWATDFTTTTGRLDALYEGQDPTVIASAGPSFGRSFAEDDVKLAVFRWHDNTFRRITGPFPIYDEEEGYYLYSRYKVDDVVWEGETYYARYSDQDIGIRYQDIYDTVDYESLHAQAPLPNWILEAPKESPKGVDVDSTPLRLRPWDVSTVQNVLQYLDIVRDLGVNVDFYEWGDKVRIVVHDTLIPDSPFGSFDVFTSIGFDDPERAFHGENDSLEFSPVGVGYSHNTSYWSHRYDSYIRYGERFVHHPFGMTVNALYNDESVHEVMISATRDQLRTPLSPFAVDSLTHPTTSYPSWSIPYTPYFAEALIPGLSPTYHRDDRVVMTATNHSAQPPLSGTRVFERVHAGPGRPPAEAPAVPILGGRGVLHPYSGNLNLVFPVISFATPDAGPDLTLVYNTTEGTDHGFGPGWRTNYDIRVVLPGDHRIQLGFGLTTGAVIDESGWRTPLTGGSLDPLWSITYNSDGAATHDFRAGEYTRLLRQDNWRLYFDADGWLIRKTSIREETIRIERDPVTKRVAHLHDERHPSRSIPLETTAHLTALGITVATRSISGVALPVGIKRLETTAAGRGGEAGDWTFAYDAETAEPADAAWIMTSATLNGTSKHGTFSFTDGGPDVEIALTYSASLPRDGRVQSVRVGPTGGGGVTTTRGLSGTLSSGTVSRDDGASWQFQAGTTALWTRRTDAEGHVHHQQLVTSFPTNDPDFGRGLSRRVTRWTGPLTGDTRFQQTIERYDSRGNLIESEHVLSATESALTTYRWTDLRDQNPAVIGARLVQEVRQVGVLLEAGGAEQDLVHTTHYAVSGRQAGLPLRQSDPCGAMTSMTYDANGYLLRMTDPRGEKTIFGGHTTNTAGNPLTVIDPMGRETTLTRDDHGAVESVTDRYGFQTAVERNASRLPTVQSLPKRGSAPERAVTDQVDPLGNVTETTDTQGRKVRVVYDRRFRVVRREILPGTGGEAVVSNDPHVATDAAAAAQVPVPVVEIAYDQTGLSGGRWRMQTSVGGVVQNTTIVDALGRTHETRTPIVLQPATAPSAKTDSVVTYQYHPVSGSLTGITDPRNAAWVTTIASDLAGRQIGTKTPSGITTTTTLNTVGWTLAQTLVDHDQTTRMAYDGCGRVLRTVNAAGGFTVAQYDAAGNLLSTDSGAGRGPRMTINAAGEVTSVTDAFGATTNQEWLPNEPILRTTSQRGPGQILEHTQTLDDRALATQFASRIPSGSSEDAVQVTLSLRNDGTPSVAPSTLGAEQRFRVDGFGRSLQTAPQQWMNGQLVEIPQTVTQRDALGQVVGTAQGLGRRDQAVTDATGAVIAQKDNAQATDGAPTETSVAWEVVERDLAGRTLVHRQLTGDPDPAKQYLVQTMTYDQDGRLKTQTMPGRGTRRIDYSGVRVTAEYLNNELRVSHSDFDAFNQPLTTWTAGDPSQTVTRDTDAYGRVWRQQIGDEETVTFFDARTGVSTGTRTSTGLVRLGRDEAGRVTTTTDAEGRTVHTEYDARDRVIARIHPDGRRESMTYVKDTSLVKAHFNGVDTTQVHDYAPDGFRTNTSTQRGSEPAVVTTFARSIATTSSGVANGVISTVTQDGQTQIMTSDRVGRMVSLQYPGQDPIATTYDRAGRQVTHGDKSYTYNADGLVETITQAGTGATVIFGYTAEGWVSSVTLPHGVTRTYGHDLAGRITGMTQLVGDSAEPWTVTRDTQGRVVSMTGPDSSRSFTYRQQRLVRERRTGDGSALTLYRYDASGNRIAQSTFAEPVAKNLAITAGTIPTAVTVITGTWNAPANGQLAVTATTGTAMADVAQVSTGEEAVAEHTLTVAVGGTTTGTVAAGAAFEGTAFRYHLLWQRRPLSTGFGEQEGRLLIQRVDRGTEATTDVAVSEWAADGATSRTLRLTWWPDGSLEVATGPASSETAISWRVGTTELPSLPSNASIALVALAADGATSASATFSTVQWSVTTANRAAWTAIYNAANELVSRTETGTAGTATEIYEYSPAGELTDLQRTGYNPQTIQYGYDAFNRRISQTVQNTQGTASYGYAYHLNTWRRQSLTHPNGDVTAFAWDGQDLIRETTTLAGGGSSSQGYFNYRGQPLWQHGSTPSSVTVYGRDLLGDITGHIVPASLPDEPLPGMAVYARKFRHDAFGVRSETLRQVEFGGVVSYVTPSTASFGPSYKGQYQDPAGDIYLRHRYYLPQLGAFGSVDPAKAGGNWHAYCGGDPVNRTDPTGLDYIYTEGNKVFWQSEQEGGGWFGSDIDVGDPVEIGTFDGGDWVRVNPQWASSDGSKGALVSLRALQSAASKAYTADSVGRDQWSRALSFRWGVLRGAQNDRQTYSMTPALDFSYGALKVLYEPLGLVKNGVQGAYGRVAGDPLTSGNLGGTYDSVLFGYTASRLDAGDGRLVAGLKTGGTVFVRGNPITGIPMAANDVYQGFATGDYERAGGGTAGLGLHLVAVGGSLRGAPFSQQLGTPTFANFATTINTIGWRGFARQQASTPTFGWLLEYGRGRLAGRTSVDAHLQANRWLGALHENILEYGLRNTSADVRTQVSVRPFDQSGDLVGYNTRVDFMATTLAAEILLIEGKASAAAPFTPRQATGYPLIESYGGVIRGAKGGPNYPAGTELAPQPVLVLRWVNGRWVAVPVGADGQ